MNAKKRTVGNFEGRFQSTEYIGTYYPSDVGDENTKLLRFYNEAYENIHGDKLIEVGGGPTIYQLISPVKVVKQILFTDALQNNIDSVESWLRGEDVGVWNQYIKVVLDLEGQPSDLPHVLQRAELIRERCQSVSLLDISSQEEIQRLVMTYGYFDIVSSAFCIDSITSSYSQWRTLLDNLLALLSSKGTLVLTSLGGSKNGYHVGDKVFPSVNLNAAQIKHELTLRGLHLKENHYEFISSSRENQESYDGLICISATRE